MIKTELTGIERELVLKYLEDGNVPVTVTAVSSKTTGKQDESAQSAVFPVAIKPSNMKLLDKGVILLENPKQAINSFAGKRVKVEFYFNKLGLSFITDMKRVSSGLAIVIPETISRIGDSEVPYDHKFEAVLFYSCGNNRNVHIDCLPEPSYTLFSKPVWSDIVSENSVKAKEYLERFVKDAKKQNTAGNGLYLIPACRYLTEKCKAVKAVEGRADPLKILYVDSDCILFGQENDSVQLISGTEYALKMSFPIADGPIDKREVFVTCLVQSFYTGDNERKCTKCIYTSVKEEDKRFIYEMVNKNILK